MKLAIKDSVVYPLTRKRFDADNYNPPETNFRYGMEIIINHFRRTCERSFESIKIKIEEGL